MRSTHFADRLFDAVKRKGAPLCVGLDPHTDLLPTELITKTRTGANDPLESLVKATGEFLYRILDVIHPYAAAVKPQFAFFERLGFGGMRLLQQVCKKAQDRGLIVIGDAKRGDIGSTAAAYADAYVALDSQAVPAPVPLDAITLNPYLGWDSIQPFLKSTSNGVFILVKTSNASSGEIQDIETSRGTVSEIIAESISKMGQSRLGQCGYSDIGAVVGATYPAQAQKLREIMPHTPFLIPGFGFQGGTARDAVITLDKNGLGGIINSSRDILFAFRTGRYRDYRYSSSSHHYLFSVEDACRDAVAQLQNALNR